MPSLNPFQYLQKPQSILAGMVLGAERELGLDTQWSGGQREQNNADEEWIKQLKAKGEDTSLLEAKLTGANNNARGITGVWDGLKKGAGSNIQLSDIVDARLTPEQQASWKGGIPGQLASTFMNVGGDPVNVIPGGTLGKIPGIAKVAPKLGELAKLGELEGAGRGTKALAALSNRSPTFVKGAYHGLIGSGSVNGALLTGAANVGLKKAGEKTGFSLTEMLARKLPGNVGKLGEAERVLGTNGRTLIGAGDEIGDIAGRQVGDWSELPGDAIDAVSSRGRRVAGEVSGTANRRTPGSATGGARRGVTDTRISVEGNPSVPSPYDDLPSTTDTRIGGPALPKATPLPGDELIGGTTDSRIISQMAADKPSLIEQLKTPRGRRVPGAATPSARRAEGTAHRIAGTPDLPEFMSPKTSAPVGSNIAQKESEDAAQRIIDELKAPKIDKAAEIFPDIRKASGPTPRFTAEQKAAVKEAGIDPRFGTTSSVDVPERSLESIMAERSAGQAAIDEERRLAQQPFTGPDKRGVAKPPEEQLLDLLTPKRAPSNYKATPKATAVDEAITKRTPTKPRTDAQKEARRVAAAEKRTGRVSTARPETKAKAEKIARTVKSGKATPKTEEEMKALIGGNDGKAATALIEAILKDR